VTTKARVIDAIPTSGLFRTLDICERTGLTLGQVSSVVRNLGFVPVLEVVSDGGRHFYYESKKR
jgi:hypothetical protein